MDINEGEEIVSLDEQSADGWQYSLRPRRLNEYIGRAGSSNTLDRTR